MKIIFFEVEPWECSTFESLQAEHNVEFIQHPLTQENAETYQGAEIISTFLYSELDAQVLKQLPHLRLITTRSTGFDQIDINYCNEHKITVCNVPTYGENTVAEHVFALLLTLSHRLTEAIDRTRRGDFSQKGLQGFDLQGKTLGVIGTGNIGQCVIKIAQGFQMEVIAFDVKPQEPLAAELGFRYATMEEVLATADIITLHVPAHPKTHHLIAQEQFDQMKPGTILINTSRGSVVDVEALIQALATGRVAAAGLDVLPEEPVMREEAELLRSVYRKQHNLETLLANHILLRLRNVIITPHSAFNTREALQRILDTTIENIVSFLQGCSNNIVSNVDAPA